MALAETLDMLTYTIWPSTDAFTVSPVSEKSGSKEAIPNYTHTPLTVINVLNTVGETLVALVTIIGNTLVLASILKEPQLRTVTNYFVASLAAADWLVGVLGIPCAQVAFYGYPSNFYGCLFMNSTILILTQISIFGLLVIAVERFLAIKYPFFYRAHMNEQAAVVMIVLTWVLAIGVGILPLLGWNLQDTYQGQCAFMEVIGMTYMVYLNFIGCVLTPLVIMFAIYGYVYLVVRKQRRQIAALQLPTPKQPQVQVNIISSHPQSQTQKSVSSATKTKRNFAKETHAAKWFAIVLALFTICWLPLHIMNTITLLTNQNNGYCILLAVLLSHANSAINPVLYAYANTKFKTAFRRLLGLQVISPLEEMSVSYSMAPVR